MIYVLGRSQEYQLRLHDAAKNYLELAERFPNHPRSKTSVERAERLAVAEGDFALAARSANIEAERAPTEKERLAKYTRAAEYLDKDGEPSRALQTARKGQRASKTVAERMRAQILVARLNYKSGSEQEALDDLVVLGKQLEKSRGKMSAQEYGSLVGEVYVMLGDEARRQFNDFRIAERGDDVQKNVTQKTEYFANLVADYDRAAAGGDPRWSSEARFRIGEAAEALADEIAAVPARRGEQVTLKAQSRNNATIQRLQALSRKYHSSNVLTARQNPSLYQDNDWVKKSSLRINGETSASPKARHKDIMPTAVQNNLPSEWSL
jgi:hypothetical protein